MTFKVILVDGVKHVEDENPEAVCIPIDRVYKRLEVARGRAAKQLEIAAGLEAMLTEAGEPLERPKPEEPIEPEEIPEK